MHSTGAQPTHTPDSRQGYCALHRRTTYPHSRQQVRLLCTPQVHNLPTLQTAGKVTVHSTGAQPTHTPDSRQGYCALHRRTTYPHSRQQARLLCTPQVHNLPTLQTAGKVTVHSTGAQPTHTPDSRQGYCALHRCTTYPHSRQQARLLCTPQVHHLPTLQTAGKVTVHSTGAQPTHTPDSRQGYCALHRCTTYPHSRQQARLQCTPQVHNLPTLQTAGKVTVHSTGAQPTHTPDSRQGYCALHRRTTYPHSRQQARLLCTPQAHNLPTLQTAGKVTVHSTGAQPTHTPDSRQGYCALHRCTTYPHSRQQARLLCTPQVHNLPTLQTAGKVTVHSTGAQPTHTPDSRQGYCALHRRTTYPHSRQQARLLCTPQVHNLPTLQTAGKVTVHSTGAQPTHTPDSRQGYCALHRCTTYPHSRQQARLLCTPQVHNLPTLQTAGKVTVHSTGAQPTHTPDSRQGYCALHRCTTYPHSRQQARLLCTPQVHNLPTLQTAGKVTVHSTGAQPTHTPDSRQGYCALHRCTTYPHSRQHARLLCTPQVLQWSPLLFFNSLHLGRGCQRSLNNVLRTAYSDGTVISRYYQPRHSDLFQLQRSVTTYSGDKVVSCCHNLDI